MRRDSERGKKAESMVSDLDVRGEGSQNGGKDSQGILKLIWWGSYGQIQWGG